VDPLVKILQHKGQWRPCTGQSLDISPARKAYPCFFLQLLAKKTQQAAQIPQKNFGKSKEETDTKQSSARSTLAVTSQVQQAV